MTGRVSTEMREVMLLIIMGGMTPYAAAKKVGVALTTVYRSKLYIAWRDGVKKRW